MNHRFQLVDVFSDQAFMGNPVAVVFDADNLATDVLQQITRWLNLSETVFLLAPTTSDADYRVRIFTLDREMPFAGHPTLGCCHAWLAAGGVPRRANRIIQECGAGLVAIRQGERALAFAAPPLIRSGPVTEAELENIIQVLRIKRSQVVDAHWADNGPGWVVVLLESAEDVLAVEPAPGPFARVDIGIVGPYVAENNGDGKPEFELRAFFTDHHGRLTEDPVTGSLNASTAQWLLATGRARAPYMASQGTRLGRAGRIHISQDGDGSIWVGGDTTTLFTGSCTI
ncbi:MAG: PhzF family phenazine biosynthesis protein [Akkermansiaceae bacterium]|nr:PhzF family phenazine biosynthesis protein [Armatimonadota bacterium]